MTPTNSFHADHQVTTNKQEPLFTAGLCHTKPGSAWLSQKVDSLSFQTIQSHFSLPLFARPSVNPSTLLNPRAYLGLFILHPSQYVRAVPGNPTVLSHSLQDIPVNPLKDNHQAAQQRKQLIRFLLQLSPESRRVLQIFRRKGGFAKQRQDCKEKVLPGQDLVQ